MSTLDELGARVDVWEAINNPAYRDCLPIWEAHDLVVIDDVERALADGLALKRWWEEKEASGSYANPFELVRTSNRAERVTGFFDTSSLNGKDFPVMGLVQEMVFDKSKQAGAELVRDELREFVLHYFMRVSATHEPEVFVAGDQYSRGAIQAALQPFSFCPESVNSQSGFGYSQLYYKLRESGYTGKFPAHLQERIVDLRRMSDVYDWIALQVKIFDFNLTYMPFADNLFSLVFPQQEETYIAISHDFIVDQDRPDPETLGRFSIGYALLRPAPHRTIFAYGPGYFTAGFQTIDFEINHRGETRARLVFVANRPSNVVNLDLNPVKLGFGIADLMTLGLTSRFLAPVRNVLEQISPQIENFDPLMTYIWFVNLLTGGLAKDELCASLTALEKNPMLLTHFMEHYYLISGALMTWRKVQNWLDPADVPEGVREGTSS
jgi:hypothetical protein